jgi:putative ABC transport system permease protein
MTALDRKLVRDLWHMKGQALAISLVVASGVGVFVMAVGTWDFLKSTRDAYYDRYRFADVFATVKRAPRTVLGRIREIPGVASAEARILRDVTLDVPGLSEPAVGRLISLPVHDVPLLNRLHLSSGRLLNPAQGGEVLVSEQFDDANRLRPGDSFRAVINGRLQSLRIAGIVLSPEYVFTIRPGDLVPDDKRFGILWMNEPEMEAALDMEGAFNDVSLRLMHGASQEEVIRRLDLLLAPYGGVGAYGHESQTSARFVGDELKQLRAIAVVAPSIFFGVAVFLLNVVLTRIVGTQREQIAALKAFGYSNSDVGVHYLKFVLLITFVGGVLGVLIGEWLAQGMAEMYSQFYRFPVFQYRVNWNLPGLVLALSLFAAALGTVQPVLGAVSLPPAEAMRPAPPGKFKPTVIERIGVERLFSISARMILRELERRPLKSLLSSVGIGFAVAVLVMGRFGVDAFDYMIDFQFYLAQRHDIGVTFYDATSASAAFDVEHLPGVQRVETYRAVPVRLRSGHRTHRTAIMGLGPDRDLHRVLDVDERPVTLPLDGLALGDKLAELLGVALGGTVTVEVLEGKRPVIDVPVSAVFKEYAGTNSYMNKDALHRLLEEGPVLSGAYLTVDPGRQDELYADLKQVPRIAGVSLKTSAVESFRKTVAENQLRMQSINIMFACVIAFGVVYNTARISLAERSRELATLRVIGFTRGEISGILLGELAILTLAALPIGFAVGYLFCWAMAQGFESEMFRIPVVITRGNLAFASLVTLGAALFSGMVVRRRLDELDLVAVLKSRD